MNKTKWALFAIVFLLTHSIYGQSQLNFEHLPVNGTTCLLQDQTGFIWIGTYDGLNRFDGYQVKEYRFDPDDEQSLSNNYIRTIFEDTSGKIWIGTRGGGLNCFDPNTDLFTHFRYDPDDSTSLSDDRVEAIFQDHNGYLWIGTLGGGLNCLNITNDTYLEENSFIRFRHHPNDTTSLSDNNVSAIYEDRQHNLWVGTWKGGLDRLDTKTEHFEHFKHDPKNPKTISKGLIRSIYQDQMDNLWIGLWGGGLNLMDRESGHFTAYTHDPDDTTSLSNNRVWTLYEDQDNNFWIGTRGGGLNRMNRSTGAFTSYRHSPHDPSSLSDDFIRAILEDQQGNLWIGMDTEWGGLDRLDRTSSWIEHYRHNPNDPNSLMDDFIRAIHEDRDGNLWIGTIKGLNYIDRVTGEITHYRHDPEDPTSLANALIRSIYEDKQGNLWIGTWGDGLDLFDRKTRQFKHFRHNPKDPYSISSNMIFFGLFEDRQGNFWVSTYGGGLNLLDRSTGRFKHFRHNPNDPHSLADDIVRVIFEDSKGNLWIGMEGEGLDRLNRETSQFEHFRHNPKDSLSLSENYVQVIYEDHLEQVWVGTWGGGLNRIEQDPQNNRIYFTHFQEQHGLANNIVFDILEDDEQHLWMSTRRGLSRFDPVSEKFTNYDIRDNDRQINHWAHYKSQNGQFYFGGGIGGIYHFDPKKLKKETYIPPIVFTRFARYNKRGRQMAPILEPGINHKDTLLLSFRDNILDIEFAALNFIKPEKTQYAYWLEGLNDQWISLGNKHSIMLTDLDPGDYTLHITSSDNKGNLNAASRQLYLSIAPPWWWNDWSILSYILLFWGLLYLIRCLELRLQRSKLSMEREKNLHLQRVDQLKDQFLSNTSHELQTPLNGIIGLSESIYDSVETIQPEELRENLDMIISSGKRLANMVNDILDFSKLKNHQIQLRKRPVYIKPLVNAILKISQLLLAGKDIRLESNIPDDLPPVYADEDRIQQIMFNLVGNAIKFTDKGYIRVSAHVSGTNPGAIQISVEDTGIGIPEHKRKIIFEPFQQADGSISRKFGGTGLGLSISKQLVELQGGKMWVESPIDQPSEKGTSSQHHPSSKEGNGTIFFFTLPVHQKEIEGSPSEEHPLTFPKDENVLIINEQETSSRPEPEEERPHPYEPTDISAPILAPSLGKGKIHSKPIHILIVDDEPINHKVLRNHLSEHAIRISSAMNGHAALQLLNSNESFDLVLLDVMMPRMSGYEVCQIIRKNHLPSELPVIMISARNQVKDKVQGLSVGANDYLTKPFSKQELMARVQTQLHLHRIHLVTSKFVPNAFLRLLGRKRITDVMLGDQTERIVTVLFTDIRDYTTLSETMTPQDNFNFVNAYNGRMGPYIRKYDGFINQYLGDAIMAVFPQQPVDALQSAVEMQGALQKYNRKRIAKGKRAIKAGTGLHTGQLIMGIIGDHRRMDAATISDTVNTTSRLESLTKHYGVNILLSEDCWQQVQSNEHSHQLNYTFRYLGKVCVKGRRGPIDIHECINGDAPEVVDKKLQTLTDFDSGMNYFLAKKFTSAIADFDRVLKMHPQDQTTQFFREKSIYYQINGTPPDWNGVELMTEK